jgi:hypothetical protein
VLIAVLRMCTSDSAVTCVLLHIPAPASYPGVTGREQAMVLTGLIIIAAGLRALMAPGVPGIQRKLPVPMPADFVRPGLPRRGGLAERRLSVIAPFRA